MGGGVQDGGNIAGMVCCHPPSFGHGAAFPSYSNELTFKLEALAQMYCRSCCQIVSLSEVST